MRPSASCYRFDRPVWIVLALDRDGVAARIADLQVGAAVETREAEIGEADARAERDGVRARIAALEQVAQVFERHCPCGSRRSSTDC